MKLMATEYQKEVVRQCWESMARRKEARLNPPPPPPPLATVLRRTIEKRWGTVKAKFNSAKGKFSSSLLPSVNLQFAEEGDEADRLLAEEEPEEGVVSECRPPLNLESMANSLFV
jgi:hypothetical protein